MKWELFKKSCQFRTKGFRQHGDNIRAAIYFEDQEFAMFTSGIEKLVLSFTDNEGEATNMCLVHIDPHGKFEQHLVPPKPKYYMYLHFWGTTCSNDVRTEDGRG